MPDEPEVIRQQMEETRTALAEKLETLEHQVADTVTAATETVTSVKEAVQETVETVKESFHETVETVKHTFDLSAQVDRHPWLAVGGSVLTGFLVGRLLGRVTRSFARPEYLAPPEDYGAPPPPDGWRERPAPESAEVPAERREKPEPGLLAGLAQQYSGEINKLKSLAIGTALGLVRDSLVSSAPEPLRPQLTEVMNSFTTKLGGETIHGPVLEHFTAGRGRAQAPSAPRGTPPGPGKGVDEWEGALS